MHNPAYQKLEGTWRGLKYLISNSSTSDTLKIKVFNVTKKDLLKDLEKASEFDQSALFKKVYEEEYGQLGGLARFGQASAANTGAAAQETGTNIASLLAAQGAATANGQLAAGKAFGQIPNAISSGLGIFSGLKGKF
jgi:type VI secretion system protein ImpC